MAHLSNLDTERVSSRYGQHTRAPRNKIHDLTHQLVKRLIHINAALGRRFNERHPKFSKAVRKRLPLFGRHLAVINEFTLTEKRQKA